MTKEVPLEIEGTVAELLRNSTFRVTLVNGHSVLATIAGKMRKFRIRVLAGDRVTLVNGHSVLATIAGKMRKFRIRVLAGDRVTLALSPYDLTRGRIVYRHK